VPRHDAGQPTILTDNVNEELLRRPLHADSAFIRRFVVFFGPLSSVFGFMTFGVMLWVFALRPCAVPLGLVRRVLWRTHLASSRGPPGSSRHWRAWWSGYRVLIEVGKRIFYCAAATAPDGRRPYGRRRRQRRRAAYFSVGTRR